MTLDLHGGIRFIMPLTYAQTSNKKTLFPNSVAITSKISATWTARKKRTKKNCVNFSISRWFPGCGHPQDTY